MIKKRKKRKEKRKIEEQKAEGRRQAQRRFYENHKAQVLEKRKEPYLGHREEIKEKNLAHYHYKRDLSVGAEVPEEE